MHTTQRALVVIEALLRCDIPDILSHLDLVMEELTTLCGASHSTIKTKANKVSTHNTLYRDSVYLIQYAAATLQYYVCTQRRLDARHTL